MSLTIWLPGLVRICHQWSLPKNLFLFGSTYQTGRMSCFSNRPGERKTCQRSPMCTTSTTARPTAGTGVGVLFREHGNPCTVLEKIEFPVEEVGENDVLAQMMVAPINPADINIIQGIYPIKPPLPAIGGNEGVAEVLKVGSQVTRLEPGNWIVPELPASGTWRTHAVFNESDVQMVPNDLPVLTVATISVNPCTAYRMLQDFTHLESGDVIIQNGGNSGVGQAVIQIAAARGLQTINIVRNRPDIDILIKILKDLGATEVITDEFLCTSAMREKMKQFPKPKLALNCVGGKIAAEMLKYLDKGSTMVTYGGMSKQPLMVPTGQLIFNNVKLEGFWMTNWNKINRGNDKRQDMLDDLFELVRKGKLNPPICEITAMENFKEAFRKVMDDNSSVKQVLVMNDSLLDN